jgi:phosphate transport system protein
MRTRSDFTRRLKDLADQVGRLGVLAAEDVRATTHVLAGERDVSDAVEASRHDAASLQKAIESSCMELMLLQQPVAGDLRLVTGSFRLVSDLVRIDEMCRDLDVLVDEIPHDAVDGLGDVLQRMSDKAATMVEMAVDAFLTSNTDEAAQVFSADDEVDALYARAEATVVGLIKAGGAHARALPELLMVAKYYERMADHAQRVADWAVFRDAGEHAGVEID